MTAPAFHPLWALVLAEVSLIVGPLVVARVGPRGAAFLDGFVIASIAGLVGLHLLPEAMSELGVAALAVALLGFVAPAILHHVGRRARSLETAIWLAVGVGLFIHAALDGAALSVVAANSPADYSAVALAVILHRLPVGLFGWWTLRASGGSRLAISVLVGVAIATLVGYGLGASFEDLGSGRAASTLIAFVAGSLLHVMVDHPPPQLSSSDRVPAWVESLGGLAGIALVGLSELEHHADRLTPFFEGLGALASRASPVLVLGLLAVVGVRRIAAGAEGPRALRALATALGRPSRARGPRGAETHLRATGVPGATALALAVVAAELGLDGLLYSVRLLGIELTSARFGAVFAVAALTAVVASRARCAAPRPASDPPALARWSFARELWSAVDAATGWILVGWVISVGIEAARFDPSAVAVPPPVVVAGLALVALPLRLDALAATPIAAALWASGLSAGAALAFLLAGAIFSASTYGLMAERIGRRLAVGLAVGLWAVIVSAGCVVDLLPRAPNPAPWPIRTSGVSLSAVVLLCTAMAISVFRRGPRRLLESLFEVDVSPAHDHPRV
jgi:hypothetical protein